MADPVAAAVAAPKKAFNFASHNMIAFLVLAAILLVLFVAYEVRKPGQLAAKVGKVPVLGKWATRQSG
jgi:hypothetical protein